MSTAKIVFVAMKTKTLLPVTRKPKSITCLRWRGEVGRRGGKKVMEKKEKKRKIRQYNTFSFCGFCAHEALPLRHTPLEYSRKYHHMGEICRDVSKSHVYDYD